MSIGNFKEQMYTRSSEESIQEHLENIYGAHIERIVKLDLGVFKVERYDGSSWVVRQFPKAMSIEDVNDDAEILKFLEQSDYPAERCAVPDAVSALDGQGVLITNFVDGDKLKGSDRAYYFLGVLLGRLHSLPLDSCSITRQGGAWHHLSVKGGPREEFDAAVSLLKSSQEVVPENQKNMYDMLLSELMKADDFHDLSQALIHPDFVPPNMVRLDVGKWVVVDWAGAGLGPRISSLGFLLWAAGHRLECVDAVVAGSVTRQVPLMLMLKP